MMIQDEDDIEDHLKRIERQRHILKIREKEDFNETHDCIYCRLTGFS